MSSPVYHGGRLDLAIQRYGGLREQWIDLSTGINPNAYPIPDLLHETWQRLPDQHAETKLYEAARKYYQVPEDFGIVAANGTQALIEILPRVLDSQHVDILHPTYGEHAHAWKKNGRHIELIEDVEEQSLVSNALVIVNPNNPDGKLYSTEQLEELSDALALRHGYLILDEAFCDANPRWSFIPKLRNNVLIYRSFGKFFGLAGLRLGFLIANKKIVHQIGNQLGPWSVSGPALEIGAQALEDYAWIEQTRSNLKDVSKGQCSLLLHCGLKIVGTNPLFTYVEHPQAKRISQALNEAHILVRDFPEMPTRLRFGLCKDKDEMSRLRKTLSGIMTDI